MYFMLLDIFMKKVFSQLWQWVLRYKKRLIYGALALFIGQICFFNLWWLGVNNTVYAQWETVTEDAKFQEKVTNWLQDFSFLNRACYILLYPILILAGALVNNSFVYAEVFKFDVVLWQLWNVVRNLANYALWFIFVFKIFQFLVNGQKSGEITKLLRSTLIAWIGIQASWFLLAVIIDISNILTYSVWWLPIHILWMQESEWDDANFWNPYVFQTVVSVDFNDPDTVHTYLSNTSTGENKWWDHFIAECETFYFGWEGDNAEELIVAPKIVYYYDWEQYHSTEQDKCHVWDDVFYLGGFAAGIDWQTCSDKKSCTDSQNKYKDSLDKAIKELKQKDRGWIMWDVSAWKVLQIKNAHSSWAGVWHVYGGTTPWLDVNNEVTWSEWKMKRLNSVLEWDDGYIWIFSALYSSLLNAGSNFRVSDAWIYKSLLNTLLSFLHTLAVGIPLLAMLVVFFMRIGIIWIAIILSPAIVLLAAFGRWDKVKNLNIKLLEYLTIWNLIGIIFSPAVICFAVSISTVLVRIISNVNAKDVLTEKTSILWWLIELNIEWMWLGMWNFICSIMWVAISWFLIWSAVKASELWKSKIVTWLHDLAKTAIWSVPIIPVPWKDWKWVNYIWMDTAFGLNGQKWIISEMTGTLKSKYEEKDNNALQAWLDPKNAKQEADSKQLSTYTERLISWNIDDTWMTSTMWIWENKSEPKTFSDFHGSDQESIINAINGLGKSRLSKIPDGHEVVLDWGKKYKFVQRRQKEENGVKLFNSDGTPNMEDVYQYVEQ